MKYFLFFFFVFFFLSCAKMGVISGGEKDTIPPALIKTTPPVNSLNINETEFSFVFDEVINTENIKEKLIVSPYISSSFEISTKKKLLVNFF